MQEAVSLAATGTPAPQPTEPPLSEFAATPARMVVHDPAATEAFDRLADVPGEELNEPTLFSAHPDRGSSPPSTRNSSARCGTPAWQWYGWPT